MTDDQLVQAVLVAIVLLIVVLAYAMFVRTQKKILEAYEVALQENKALRQALTAAKESRQLSLELTEFLKDMSQYGYSYIRVDPASVLRVSSQTSIRDGL